MAPFSVLCICLFSSCVIIPSTLCDQVVPRYKVNLDDTPEERWIPVLQQHGGQYVQTLSKIFSHLVPEPFVKVVEILSGQLELFLSNTTAAEIRGMTRYLNITMGELVLPNIMYDLTAFNRHIFGDSGRMCTSIVAQDTEGKLWHGRNLDYGQKQNYTELLKQLTIEVDFVQNGKVKYTSTTFLGLVGTMTGQKAEKFTVSLDERNQGNILENLAVLLERKATLLSHLVRETLERAESFDEAVRMLANTETAAPAYFILAGTKPGEGVVITKDRLKAKDIWKLDTEKHRWFLVETNYDHWEQPPASDNRREYAVHGMDAVGQSNINNNTLFKVLSIPPVLNGGTAYTTLMTAEQPTLYQSWIRN